MDPNANIIFGALVDESMEGEIAITVIATGFPLGKAEAEEKLAQMHQQVQASGKSVRTISEAMRAVEAKQSSSQSTPPAQQPQSAHRRVATTPAKRADTASEESAEDVSPRSRQRVGISESPEKPSEPTTHTHTHSHAQVSPRMCGSATSRGDDVTDGGACADDGCLLCVTEIVEDSEHGGRRLAGLPQSSTTQSVSGFEFGRPRECLCLAVWESRGV